ncbi:MAG: hypothetical protein KDA32_09085 [Phycisphaerales bacterium]|nr:hypothetical protein [Phycisphaerales bacterium]
MLGRTMWFPLIVTSVLLAFSASETRGDRPVPVSQDGVIGVGAIRHSPRTLHPSAYYDPRTGSLRPAPQRAFSLRGTQIAYDNFTSVTGGLFTTNVALTPQPCEGDPNCAFDPNNLFVWFMFAGSEALDPFAGPQAACGDPNLTLICHYDQIHDDYRGERSAFGLGPSDPTFGVTRDLAGFHIAVWNNFPSPRRVCLLLEFADPNGALIGATNDSSPCFTLPNAGWWNLNATLDPNSHVPVPAVGFVGVDFFNTAFDPNDNPIPLTEMGWLFAAGRVGGGATLEPNDTIALGQSTGNYWIQTTSNTAGEMYISPGVLNQSVASGDLVNFFFLDPNGQEFSHNLPVQISVKLAGSAPDYDGDGLPDSSDPFPHIFNPGGDPLVGAALDRIDWRTTNSLPLASPLSDALCGITLPNIGDEVLFVNVEWDGTPLVVNMPIASGGFAPDLPIQTWWTHTILGPAGVEPNLVTLGISVTRDRVFAPSPIPADFFTVPVGEVSRDAGNDETVLETVPDDVAAQPEPAPMPAPVIETVNRPRFNMVDLDEASESSACTAGAVASSMVWLNRLYCLGLPDNPGVKDTTLDEIEGFLQTGAGTGYDNMLPGKRAYIRKHKLPLKVEAQGLSAGGSAMDFNPEDLFKQLKLGQDVEFGLRWGAPNFDAHGHTVSAVQMTREVKAGGAICYTLTRLDDGDQDSPGGNDRSIIGRLEKRDTSMPPDGIPDQWFLIYSLTEGGATKASRLVHWMAESPTKAAINRAIKMKASALSDYITALGTAAPDAAQAAEILRQACHIDWLAKVLLENVNCDADSTAAQIAKAQQIATAANGLKDMAKTVEGDAAMTAQVGAKAVMLCTLSGELTGLYPADRDFDDVPDSVDNAPDSANPDQADCNGDGIGDVDQLENNDINNNGIPDDCEAPAGTPNWFDFFSMRGFRKDLPDFYQHQYWCVVAGWEAAGGWCAPTAFANCLYSFKVNGYPNLLMTAPDIDDPNQWLLNSCLAILELRTPVFNINPAMAIQKYLDDKGYGERACPDPNGRGGGLKYTQYTVNQTNGNVTYVNAAGREMRRRGNAFSIYKKELLDGQDVLIRLAADTRRVGLAATDFECLWWRGPNFDGGNYHFVTGAGVDCGTDANPKMLIYFADPDSNKGNAKADSGWPAGGDPNDPNYIAAKAALLARQYDGNDPIPIPDRAPNMRLDPVNFADYYDCQEVAADGYTIDTAGKYHNVRIRRIDTICPVKAAPKPSTPSTSGIRRPFLFGAGRVTECDRILIYPIGAEPVPFSPAPTTDPNFFDPSGDVWLRSYVPAGLPDPDGNIRPEAGILFETAGSLAPGEFASGAVLTDVDFDSFDVLVRAKNAPDPNDAWYVQPIGGPTVPFVETVLPGQVGCLGDVDLADLSGLLAVFGATVGDANYLPAADFNHDGAIDLSDLSGLLAVFGSFCQ